MALRVLFDHQKFSTQKFGGISRYFNNLIQAIKKDPQFDYKLGVLASNNYYIKNEKLKLQLAGKLLSEPSLAYRINDIYCKNLLNAGHFDVFHPTYYDPYFINRTRKPVVVTIHDMTYERFPEYFWAHDPLTRQKRLNVERADHIIAISETTKNDLIKYSKVDPGKISVIYHGMDLDEPFLTSAVNVPEQYILFVGDRSGYKNFYLFIDAFKELSLKHPDLKVILTGGGSMGIADLELLRRLDLQASVMHVQASDEQLNYLYQNALLFVYPSLHEGFGLPILEAYQAGCPVILSDTECFREIAADAALFFEKSDKDSLITALEMLINDSGLRKSLSLKGKERLREFPLDKSIEKTLQVYKSLG
ncbi:glycosyltransferase family 4 protein [Desertivirga xinjiangensis]|uniref:glycosyltransferase family 4 protein n=1 Tax=Desertivirga xinjiangensis TaxID=539206 RepID=UPI00210DF1B7|nr:glycosyltransferase family 1 protein [Pedobacter xinjiangensis]